MFSEPSVVSISSSKFIPFNVSFPFLEDLAGSLFARLIFSLLITHKQPRAMLIRDRILDFRRIPASQLRPNPRNWRTHPAAQQEAMRGMLAEIGYADALLVRERDDGTLELIDGHLRAELSPASEVPVLVLDLDDNEAAQLLALHDPLAAMADTDQELLNDLLAEVETRNEALRKQLDALASPIDIQPVNDETTEVAIPEIYQVVVECQNEEEQQAVYESLTAAGHRCRLVNL